MSDTEKIAVQQDQQDDERREHSKNPADTIRAQDVNLALVESLFGNDPGPTIAVVTGRSNAGKSKVITSEHIPVEVRSMHKLGLWEKGRSQTNPEIATAEQAVKDYDAQRESLTGRRVSVTRILILTYEGEGSAIMQQLDRSLAVGDLDFGDLQIKVVQSPYRDLGPVEPRPEMSKDEFITTTLADAGMAMDPDHAYRLIEATRQPK